MTGYPYRLDRSSAVQICRAYEGIPDSKYISHQATALPFRYCEMINVASSKKANSTCRTAV
jgi:hypothetical protein